MKILSLFALLAITISLSSCDRCMTCSYMEYQGEEITEEQCGNGEEIEAFSKEIERKSEENRSAFNCIENH